jgi:hypothetical protein
MREDRSSIGTGILLVTVGLLFLADHQGLLSFNKLWPVILIVLGVTMLVFPKDGTVDVGVVAGRRGAAQRQRSRMGGAIWLIMSGVLLLANQNHWMSLRQSWPLFIVAGGLAMIFGSLGGRRSPSAPENNSGQSGTDIPFGGQDR